MRLYRKNCDKEDATTARLEAGSRFEDRYQTRHGRKRAKVMAKDSDIARQYRLYSGLPTRYWHHDSTELVEHDPFSEL